jgi:Obg family GTPase CgtA-like protein
MNPAIAVLAKKLKLPIALYRIEGGYGVQPRWCDSTRKGKMRALVSRVIKPEEYAEFTNEELMNKIADILDNMTDTEMYAEEELESHVIYKFKNEKPYTIRRDNDVWVIEGDEIEKLFKMTKFTEDESIMRFGRKLKGMGIEEELERLGAERGDEVQILDYLFIFKE